MSSTLIALLIQLCGMDVQSLDDAISTLKKNEQLYSDLDVHFTVRYSTGDRSGLPSRTIASNETTVAFVSQGGLYRVESEEAAVTGDGKQIPRIDIQSFDGKETLLVTNNQVANRRVGRDETSLAVRPHDILLHGSSVQVPLSVYLAGSEFMAGHPLGDKSAVRVSKTEFLGVEEFKGLLCYHIAVSGGPNEGALLGRRKFWLAIDRNLLPVRVLSYSLPYSDKIPCGEGITEEFTELEPGIWFPVLARYTAFDKETIQESGQQVVRWEEVYTASKVSLHPDYPPEFFRAPELADGVVVYDIHDGEIVDSKRVGGPITTVNHVDGSWIPIALVILGALSLMMIANKWRRRHR